MEAHANNAGKTGGIAGSYTWRLWKNGTATNRIDVFSNVRSDEPNVFNDCPCHKVHQCLQITFVWAPTFDGQLGVMYVAMRWKSDVVLIVEPGTPTRD